MWKCQEMKGVVCLEQRATTTTRLGDLGARRQDDGLDGFIEDLLQSLLGQCRAFHELDGLDLLCHVLSLLSCDWGQSFLSQRFQLVGILSQVELGANQDDFSSRAVLFIQIQESVSIIIWDQTWKSEDQIQVQDRT